MRAPQPPLSRCSKGTGKLEDGLEDYLRVSMSTVILPTAWLIAYDATKRVLSRVSLQFYRTLYKIDFQPFAKFHLWHPVLRLLCNYIVLL
jgi:hypothetical protein